MSAAFSKWFVSHPVLVVMAKELVDLFRDRRTVAISLLLGPLLMPALILGLGKLVSSRISTQLEKPLTVPVVGAEHAPNLMAWLEGQNIVIAKPPADPNLGSPQRALPEELELDKFPSRANPGSPLPPRLPARRAPAPTEVPTESEGPSLVPPDEAPHSDLPAPRSESAVPTPIPEKTFADDSPIELLVESPAQRPIGSGVTFDLTIKNTSDQPVRNVSVTCKFDDVLTFPGGGVGLSIADVAGKGVPAALLMSNLQAAVRAFAQEGAAPGAVCTAVNRLLCRNMASGRFVTFCYVSVDAAARKLTYANAGHNPPILLRASGRADLLPQRPHQRRAG